MTNWAGCTLRREAIVDSTNRQARLWARDGAPHGAVLIADSQTAGRGRRGRQWLSPPGTGLWLSIVLRPEWPPERLPLLTFAIALAGLDAIEAATGLCGAAKWPNDLLVSGRKVAGILLEKEGDAVVAGIGINARQRPCDFPPELAESAASLAMLAGRDIAPRSLEAPFLAALARWVDAPEGLIGAFSARCATLGAQVRVLAGEEEYEGLAERIDAEGALWVRPDGGEARRVLAGDVSVRGLMGYGG
ncbi:MAG: biotin--[acetyl-CoA-carboxylase] ligase [Oscillospiraceae bacterium]|jgi:BirA family biotin operon repressor/biotin-[acetyl-CoA-carboxylase] ligase|nr:biotin--[acetyl-CoA-carboxylase] ligase [Oscillospiraceae bacterium]